MAIRNYFADLNLNLNQVTNHRLHLLTGLPSLGSSVEGQIVYNGASLVKCPYYRADTDWIKWLRSDVGENITAAWRFTNSSKPFEVSSTTKVANLNAEYLNGFSPSGAVTADTIAVRYTLGRLRVGDPALDDDAATKRYVDTLLEGVTATSDPAKAATTANLSAAYNNAAGTLTYNGSTKGAFTVDGVYPVVNDRVLVKDQADGFQNGIYKVTTVGTALINWVLTRDTMYDESGEWFTGAFIFVEGGTVNGGSGYILTTPAPIVLGTTALTFSLRNKATNYQWTRGIVATGNSISAIQASDYPLGRLVYSSSITALTFTASLDNHALIVGGGDTGIPHTISGTSTSLGKMLMGAGANDPAWTTAAWPSDCAAGDLLYASATSQWSRLSISGSAHRFLGISAGVPAWTQPQTSDIYFTNAAKLLGRYTSGSGNGEEVAIGSSLYMSSGVLDTVQPIRISDSPTFAGLTLTGLTGWLKANGSSALTVATPNLGSLGDVQISAYTNYSLLRYRTDLAKWDGAVISGTTNQIAVTHSVGPGAITLSTPQDIAATSSPTFAGLKLTGLDGWLRANGNSFLTTPGLAYSDLPVVARGSILGFSSTSIATGNVTAITSSSGTKYLKNVNGDITWVLPSLAELADVYPSMTASTWDVLQYSDGGKWSNASISGTTNRITVTKANGSVTISAPQDLHTGASPEFTGLKLTGLTGWLKGNGSNILTAHTLAYSDLPVVNRGSILGYSSAVIATGIVSAITSSTGTSYLKNVNGVITWSATSTPEAHPLLHSTYHSGVATTSPERGMLMYVNSLQVWDGLSSTGSSGMFLKGVLDGGGTTSFPTWAKPYLNDLGDVLISNPVNLQLLAYNGTKWVNSTPSFPTGAGNGSTGWAAIWNGASVLRRSTVLWDSGTQLGVGVTPFEGFHVGSAHMIRYDYISTPSIVVTDGSNRLISGVPLPTGSAPARKVTALQTVTSGMLSFSITHNLATKDIMVMLRNTSTDELVEASYVATSVSAVRIDLNPPEGGINLSVVIVG